MVSFFMLGQLYFYYVHRSYGRNSGIVWIPMICVIVGYPFRSVKPRYEEHGTALKGLLAEGILDQNGAEVSLVPAKPAIDVRSLPLSKSYKVRVL